MGLSGKSAPGGGCETPLLIAVLFPNVSPLQPVGLWPGGWLGWVAEQRLRGGLSLCGAQGGPQGRLRGAAGPWPPARDCKPRHWSRKREKPSWCHRWVVAISLRIVLGDTTPHTARGLLPGLLLQHLRRPGDSAYPKAQQQEPDPRARPARPSGEGQVTSRPRHLFPSPASSRGSSLRARLSTETLDTLGR